MPYLIDLNNQDNYPLMRRVKEMPSVEDTEAYIEYVNGTMQDLPDEMFVGPEEDVPDLKHDFSDLFDDTLENIAEGNYEGAIEKLNSIKERILEEMVESGERQELLVIVDDLIAYLESQLTNLPEFPSAAVLFLLFTMLAVIVVALSKKKRRFLYTLLSYIPIDDSN